MDFLTLVRTMLRQWRFVVAVLLVTFVTIAGLVNRYSPSYEAQASLLVLTPTGTGGTAVNPYAELTKPLATTAAALALALNGPEATERTREAGGSADYLVEPAADSPILGIYVKDAPDEGSALRTLDLVASEASQELERWQTKAAVPEEQQFRAEVLTRDQVGAAQTGSRDRMVAGIAFLGILAAAAAALVADGRRRASNYAPPLQYQARRSPNGSATDAAQVIHEDPLTGRIAVPPYPPATAAAAPQSETTAAAGE